MDQILEYENLVYSIASKFKNHYEFEDLVQVGEIGLIKAFKNYKEGFDTKFSTYAYTYILGEILNYIRNSRGIKVSKDMQKIYRMVESTRELLTNKLNREPSITEISLFMEVDESVVIDAINSNQFVKSLDYCVNGNEEDKEINLYDIVSYDEKSYDSDILDLRNEIEKLDDREKDIIKFRYYDGMSQQEVGSLLNSSQVNISRSETKILRKLKDKLVV